MTRFLILGALPLLLGGCVMDLFREPTPQVDTAIRYADEICSEAGRKSQSCADARRQASLRCYRTIGEVNCYTSEDPFQSSGTERSITLPVDRRPPTPSPG